MTLISGPIAPERNPNIAPQYFEPSRFVISAITRGATTTVTMTPSVIQGVTINPNYVVGQQVRLNIPFAYGIQQINEQTAFVQSLPSSTQIVLNINSTSYDAFIPSPTGAKNVPQVVAIGDVNSGTTNSSGLTNQITDIPGSFLNISPSVGGTS